MKILNITRTKNPVRGVKVYAKMQSRSRAWVEHLVAYVRTAQTRSWVCSCEDFMLRQFGVRRNCDHIKEVRTRFGRFGTKVPLT